MTTHADAILSFLTTRIAEHERKMLDGTLPAPDVDGGWANYRAAVVVRRDLFRLKDAVEKIIRSDEDTLDELVTELKTEGEKL